MERRKFIKWMGAGLAMAFVPVLPKIPEIPVEEETEIIHASTLPGSTRCPDFAPTVEIIEYTPGMEIPYEDLSKKEPVCENCHHEPRCMGNGRKYERYGNDAQGRWVPELWNKKLQNKWYRRFMEDIKQRRV
jgi:hypothetical protein